MRNQNKCLTTTRIWARAEPTQSKQADTDLQPFDASQTHTPERSLIWSGLCGSVERESSAFALRDWTRNDVEGRMEVEARAVGHG